MNITFSVTKETKEKYTKAYVEYMQTELKPSQVPFTQTKFFSLMLNNWLTRKK